MKIRTITSFFDPKIDQIDAQLEPLAVFSRELRSAVENVGFEVESVRLAASPFPSWLKGTRDEQVQILLKLEALARGQGWDYLSAGPATPDNPDAYQLIPDFLAATRNVFFS